MQTDVIRAVILAVSWTAAVYGQSNVDGVNKFCWSENVGWLNWRDANATNDGVLVGADFLSGYVWAENAGWINVGNGAGPYANTDGTDFGVNILPSGDLEGFAWGENSGWINFEGGALTNPPNPARFDFTARRFRGYAWGENIGWINLDDPTHFVGIIPDPPEVPASPHDRSKNRYVSFAPNNGSTSVAFRIEKTTAPVGTAWVGVPDADGLAPVVAAPVNRIWPEPVVHVGDCEIVPVATYEIRATGDSGLSFSPALTVDTTPQPAPKFWADTVGAFGNMVAGQWDPPNGVVNVNDYVAALQKFLGVATAPHVTVVDIQAVSSTDPCLNRVANIADVFLIIKAFQGNVYPFETNPVNCQPCP